ncbi:MAG: amidase [Acidobacteria bacterium]|mgnify:FL=1|nr:amidase [Acidobacteriota bacterium]
MSSRYFVVAAVAVSVWLSASPRAETAGELVFSVEEATIAQVHSAFKNGDLTCHTLVERYLSRIAAFDQDGPHLNAIASINPDAVEEADRLDRLFAEEGLSGPLHCVPVIVKDNIETLGWETTGGSLALKGFIPGRDATAITRLKAAGALILAKASMSDLALNALTTVNRIQGRTKNPYELDRVPAGSSGGVAVAISANFGLVGLGTDTGNSVRGPASHASIVGVRPTMGLTSRTGVIPLDLLSDVTGPMARTIADAAAVLDALAGWDPSDPATEAFRQLSNPPHVRSNLGDVPTGMRVGVLRQAYQGGPLKVDSQVARVFARAIADLKSLGVDVADSVSLENVKPSPIAERCQGLKYDLNDYLKSQGDLVPVHSLAEILASGRYDPSVDEDMRARQQAASEGPGSKACEANAAYREAVAGALSAAMDRQQLDVLIYPTWSQLPQFINHIDVQEAGQSLRFSSSAGFPALTVPMGFSTEELPLGLSLLGRAWSEPLLMRLSYAYEQATRHRRPPVLAPPIFAPFAPVDSRSVERHQRDVVQRLGIKGTRDQ